MSEEKILTEDEKKKLLLRLQMKYGAEGARIQDLIEHDIRLYGFVSLDTARAQKLLSAKILKEKNEVKE